jgi:hypothetical protein
MAQETITTTAGVVLDPFSINSTGIARRHFGLKTGKASDMHKGLHGEARFKQAFINACHFAESMTVVGPVAQMVWDKNITPSMHHALFWEGKNSGPNKDYLERIEKVMKHSTWDRINPFMLSDVVKMRLHVQPDFSFGRAFRHETKFPSATRVGEWAIADEMLRFHFGQGYFDLGDITRDETGSAVRRGTPVVSLMAVIFTFKKPTGSFEMNELTNLASWPPVIFFLPVLMPAGTTIGVTPAMGAYDYKKMVTSQPTLSSYRLALNNGNLIMPFGQPYSLMSVDKRGKAPDTLRSLSDVFKALWSQATQYCAWNTKMEFNPDVKGETGHHPMSLALEPMGAGRRIRGHNRYMGMYNMDNVDLLWETDISDTNSHFVNWTAGGRDITCYMRQLRASFSGKREAIFVLPSYFTENTAKNLQPLAMALTRYMYAGDVGLETFIAGNIVNSVTPVESHSGIRVVTETETSFLDNVLTACKVPQDGGNGGALPLHRFTGDISFDPEGDPTVFGLRMQREELEILRRGTADLKKEDYEKLLEETDVLGNFKFLDAFCSKSTKDLTSVFAEVKEKAISGERGTKAVDMLEDTLSVDLFDTEDLLF